MFWNLVGWVLCYLFLLLSLLCLYGLGWFALNCSFASRVDAKYGHDMDFCTHRWWELMYVLSCPNVLVLVVVVVVEVNGRMCVETQSICVRMIKFVWHCNCIELVRKNKCEMVRSESELLFCFCLLFVFCIIFFFLFYLIYLRVCVCVSVLTILRLLSSYIFFSSSLCFFFSLCFGNIVRLFCFCFCLFCVPVSCECVVLWMQDAVDPMWLRLQY